MPQNALSTTDDPCPHCSPDDPPVSYANGSFCDDMRLLAHAFGWPFDSRTLVGLSHASRLVCSGVGAFTLASPRRPEPSWWLVRNGSVSLGQQAVDGSFIEHRRLAAGDWFDVTGALSTPARWAEAAVVHEPLELLALPLSSLTEACEADPAFADAVRRVAQERLDDLPLDTGAREATLARLEATLVGQAPQPDVGARPSSASQPRSSTF